MDGFGRVARSLRVSVIDHCNLRCTYCMPAAGMAWLPRDQILTADEIVRTVRVFVGLGIRAVRLTGGEPLLRPDLPDIVAGIDALRPRPAIAMTTNGVTLSGAAHRLRQAGLDRVNVSLDSPTREGYARVVRRDRFGDVLRGLDVAAEAGLHPIKVNAVILPGDPEAQAVDLLRFCLDRGFELRFIEQMPIGAEPGWRPEDQVPAAEIRERLSRHFELTPLPAAVRGSDPAHRYLVNGGPATLGIIASVTEPFCAQCDRLRVTADGMLRNCLFGQDEADLRTPLRAGADDAELAEIVRAQTRRKARGHGIGEPGFMQPGRSMSAIGG